ncbi:hypothetical protein H6F32_03325 [Anabaena sp. FACHB-1237]|uniref:hypothetical protein n=1 Tax=Anabaena sp. FACHB-1237 TaxID=2692769 RepID=UPI0016801F76|nr:hypothetical protein [Anabaena sp. FACHB-1237]MBD2136640.1 hypothetical protein [Anabaena sp. FACHB-1237]
MLPKITNSNSWQQAELLMQPAFIRVVDNIRKHLDISSWKGSYQDVLIWPANTSDETKTLVTQLLRDMENATPEKVEEIKATLTTLPIPHPGYHLLLQRQEEKVSIDLWDLCYQVCFINYNPIQGTAEIDTSLIDEYGEIDWHLMENKTKMLVDNIFGNLLD